MKRTTGSQDNFATVEGEGEGIEKEGCVNQSSSNVQKAHKNAHDNFPSLRPASSKISPHFVSSEDIPDNAQSWRIANDKSVINSEASKAPGITVNASPCPPPGFNLSTKTMQNLEVISVPPGFSSKEKTTTHGDDSIRKQKPESSHAIYYSPRNFAKRNNDLLNLITKL